MRPLLLAAMALVLAACDFAGAVQQGPCANGNAAGCGQPCSDSTPCPAGFYCDAAGTCDADCIPGTRSFCAAGQICTADGRCSGNAGMDSGIVRTDAQPVDQGACASQEVSVRRVTPTVILIVDQSGSMAASFGGSDRWNSLRDSLLRQPDGFLFALEESVEFGLALYSARAPDDENVIGDCPLITYVEPSLSNYDAIERQYSPADVIDETPTGETIAELVDAIGNDPDPDPDPTIFILATDGEPDTCAQPNPQNGQEETLAEVRRAFSRGIRTFVISVGRDISRQHLQDVANAGLGNEAGDPDREFYVAGDDEGLRDALETIIGGELSCEVELDGRIADLSMACEGEVRLNGVELECNDENGWRVIDESTIEILGTACDTLLTARGATLTANFPCDVIVDLD